MCSEKWIPKPSQILHWFVVYFFYFYYHRTVFLLALRTTARWMGRLDSISWHTGPTFKHLLHCATCVSSFHLQLGAESRSFTCPTAPLTLSRAKFSRHELCYVPVVCTGLVKPARKGRWDLPGPHLACCDMADSEKKPSARCSAFCTAVEVEGCGSAGLEQQWDILK